MFSIGESAGSKVRYRRKKEKGKSGETFSYLIFTRSGHKHSRFLFLSFPTDPSKQLRVNQSLMHYFYFVRVSSWIRVYTFRWGKKVRKLMIEPLENAKILIVEDETANLLLLKRILQRKGFTFIEATQDPREGLALFQSFEPDLVCTDYRMPHINGIELIEQLSHHIPEDSYLPIVMLTADANAELEREALAKGPKIFSLNPLKLAKSKFALRICYTRVCCMVPYSSKTNAWKRWCASARLNSRSRGLTF